MRYLVKKDWVYRFQLLDGQTSYICQLSQAASGVGESGGVNRLKHTGAVHMLNIGYYRHSLDAPHGVFWSVQ